MSRETAIVIAAKRDETCPYCGAIPGYGCVTLLSGRPSVTHVGRIARAVRAERRAAR